MALDGSMAEYYRGRAEEARALADYSRDVAIKAHFETAASHWDILAHQAERAALDC